MTVNQVMAALRRLQKEGHGRQECEIFPHDNDPYQLDSGDGRVYSVDFVERSNGETFVAIRG